MATALKLKSDIKKLKAAINSKATPKSFLPKLKNQLDRAEGELKSLKEAPKGGKPKKSTSAGTEKTLTALQKLVNKKKYSVYKGRGVDLKKDAGEGALATGRRVSKGLKSNQYGSAKENKGNVYYEYRPNRLDVKQPKRKQTYPKLEDGGMMAKGGEVRYKLKGSNFGQQIENGQKFKALISKVHANQTGENKYPENLIKEIAYTGKIVKSDGSNYLKDYSYKGTLTKFEFLDDKDFIEALKYVDRPAIRKFEEGGMFEKPIAAVMDNHGNIKSEKKLERDLEYLRQAYDDKMITKDEYDKEKNEIEQQIQSLTNKEKGGYMAKGGGIYTSDDRWVVIFQNEESGELEKVTVRANNKNSAIEIAEDEGGLGNDWKFHSVKKEMASGGYMAEGGITEHGLVMGDWIVGKKDSGNIIVENDDSNYEVDLSSGERNKLMSYGMASGGELHRSEEKYAEGGQTKNFNEREFKDILDEALEHLYMGLNKIEGAMRYLEVKGQAGMKNPFAAKIGLSNLKESIEKIDEYTSKK